MNTTFTMFDQVHVALQELREFIQDQYHDQPASQAGWELEQAREHILEAFSQLFPEES